MLKLHWNFALPIFSDCNCQIFSQFELDESWVNQIGLGHEVERVLDDRSQRIQD